MTQQPAPAAAAAAPPQLSTGYSPSAAPAPSRVRPSAGTVLTKVSEATAMFWVLKVLTTAMGECLSDSLVEHFVAYAVVGAFLALVAALVWQLRQDRYRPLPYWSAVAMVSVFGTMVADGIRTGLGLSYVVTTVAFAVLVALCLTVWWLREGTLSIHSITSRRRETYYWATVMSTFALGTAVGDMTASTLHWGFFYSGILYGALILVPLLAHKRFGLGAVTAFWASYILTRPLGASWADWAWVPANAGGLALGRDTVSAILVPLFLLGLAYVAKTRSGTPQDVLAAA